ncbi:MAG TPA: methylated-DNA--[protein]-cysteine S-methyltransferase [Ignavibacteriaceae bacterium]|nr:methylated-DNA--[protein]-cysteine S-methyltransferase [Ignavibacteriaceae bacterium]
MYAQLNREKLSFREKYNAFLKRDPSYEGAFVMAVKTTGIFCRSTCSARKPKPENVEFYNSPKEAILNGYRPCKVCKPLEMNGETPGYIKKIIDEIGSNPHLKIKDYELRKRGIDPAQIRRWFKKHHNLTFHAYQRMMRINNAFGEINKGEKITEAAFESGYDSLSGFNHSYQNIFGKSPSKSKDKNVVNIVRFTTPIGPMFAAATQKGVCLLEFTDRRMLETEFKDLQKLFNAVILPGTNEYLDLLQQELKEYFEGNRRNFTVRLDTPGTEFQKTVWNELIKIPYGETVSYKHQAIKIKRPSAVRAVANANGQNRVSIVIPCHRVIGEDGSLTGYGGGLSRKKWLLDLEKKHSGKREELELNFRT